MSTSPRPSLSLVLLLAACATSPYDRALREAEKDRRDQEVMERDVEASVRRLIEEANQRDAALAEEVWVDEQEFQRVTYFVPEGSPGAVDPGGELLLSIGDPPSPPDVAREVTWTDRFALAQAQSSSYEWLECRGVTVDASVPTLRAVAAVSWTIERRSALVGTPPKRPQGPEGWFRWYPSPTWRFASGSRIEQLSGVLPAPPALPGRLGNGEERGLAREACLALTAAKPEKERHEVLIDLTYDTDAKRWVIESSRKPWPSPPKTLRWSQGLDAYEGLHVR